MPPPENRFREGNDPIMTPGNRTMSQDDSPCYQRALEAAPVSPILAREMFERPRHQPPLHRRARNGLPWAAAGLFRGTVWFAVMMCVSVVLQAQSSSESPPLKPVTGKLLHDALDQRRGLAMVGQTLRQAVSELQAGTGIAVVLDRRTDPTAQVQVSTGYVTVRESLRALAESVPETAVSLGDRFVLIGPRVAAGRLRTLTELNRSAIGELRRTMEADIYRKLVTPVSASWPDLAEPRQLIEQAAAKAGLRVDNPEDIPHDLWAAALLPDLSFGDLATLILNQFDATFEISVDGVVRVVPVSGLVAIEQRHRVPARDRNEVLQRWTKSFPNLEVSWKGTTAVVMASAEVHERLQELIRGEKSGVAAAGIKDRRFTMKAATGASIGQLVAQLRGLGIPIRIRGRTAAELAPLLRQTIEFDLQDASAEEFFGTVFRSWGAKIEVNDDEVVLTFSEESNEPNR